jgi:hypothetical protein
MGLIWVKIYLLVIISVYVKIFVVILNTGGEFLVIAVFLRVRNALLGKCQVDLFAFLSLFSFIVGFRREITDLRLPVRSIDRFHHDVKCVPNMPIITLFEGVELAVIGAPICIDFGLFVPVQDTSHGPLTVDEA